MWWFFGGQGGGCLCDGARFLPFSCSIFFFRFLEILAVMAAAAVAVMIGRWIDTLFFPLSIYLLIFFSHETRRPWFLGFHYLLDDDDASLSWR
jgi:hypothetical protein